MISVYQDEFENISKVNNVIPLATNVSHHTEASQSICRANQLVPIRWGILVFNGLTWNWKLQMLLKRDPWQVFFYEFCVIIQSSFIIQFHRSPSGDSFWHKTNMLILFTIQQYLHSKNFHWHRFHLFLITLKLDEFTRRCSVIKGILKHFSEFTGKHLRLHPLLVKL